MIVSHLNRKEMSQNLVNKVIPKYVPKNVPWHERDGLNTWFGQGKCNDFLQTTNEHFQKTKIINFDIINNKTDISKENIKQYQTVDHEEILNYPPDL